MVPALHRRVFLPLAAALLVACGDTPSEPSVDVETDALLGQVDALASADGTAQHEPPFLHALLRRAVHTVREEQGEEAARALLAPLRAVLEEGRGLRGSGDRAAIRAHLLKIRATTVGIVVGTLGAPAVDHALTLSGQVVARLQQALDARLAAGQEAGRLAEVVKRLREQHDAAVAARAAGDLHTALSKASLVIDVGRLLHARGQRDG